MRPGHHIFFFIIFSIGYLCYAQPEKVLTEFTTDNGLTINTVNDFVFDKQGFLWVATPDGLQRFDGYRFETFRHDSARKNSIPQNFISGLYKDANENLWIINYMGVFVKPEGKLEFIDLSSKLAPFNNNNLVTVASENDSTIWFLNYSAGIFSINKTSYAVKKIFSVQQNIFGEGYFLYAPIKEKGDRIWLRKRGPKNGDVFTITDQGIKQFSNSKKISIQFMIPEGRDSLVVITDKQIFMSMANDPLSPVRIVQQHVDARFAETQFISYPRPVGKNESLLVGGKYFFVFDHRTRTIKSFPYSGYFSTHYPQYLHISTRDQAGNTWFGFNAVSGIKMLPQAAQVFNLFERPDKKALPYCLAADLEGKIYVGIYTGGIEVYNKQGHYLELIKLPLNKLPFNSPRQIMMIDSSTMLIKAIYNQLLSYDLQTKKIKDITGIIPYPTTPIFVADFEPYLQRIREGEVWLSSRNNIYSIIKKKDQYNCNIVCSLPPQERVTAFYRSNDGKLWIGSIVGGWSFINGNLQRLPFTAYIKHINEDAAGNTWFATTDGIFIVNNNKVIKKLNINEGLPNPFVYGILFDENGNAWISTNRGLARIDKNWNVETYPAKMGLQGDEFNTRGYLVGPDKTFYFAGLNGINFFKPSDLPANPQSFPTLLTSIEIDNRPFADTIESSTLKELRLPSSEDNIRLSFANMDFTEPGKNKFKFWLKNVQHTWSSPQTNNTFQSVLPPGDYELHVLSSNYQGVWSKEPFVIKIIILPAWYQTTAAKIGFLVIVLIIGAVSFYFLYRNHYRKKLRKLQKDQELQNEKQRFSRDLHDNLGSQITWLSNYINQLETAAQENQPMAGKLERLKEGTGELMQTLRETIWILNKDKVSYVELFDKVVSLAARNVEVCPPLQLHTEEKISANMELNAGLALQIFRICQEAINNTCKHSGATLLKISAVSSEHLFTLSVGDNGNGFDFSGNGRDGHYGLQNMKDRALENGLEFRISTSSQEGTTVFISTHPLPFV